MNWFQQKSKIGNLYAMLSIAFPNEFTEKQRSPVNLSLFRTPRSNRRTPGLFFGVSDSAFWIKQPLKF